MNEHVPHAFRRYSLHFVNRFNDHYLTKCNSDKHYVSSTKCIKEKLHN